MTLLQITLYLIRAHLAVMLLSKWTYILGVLVEALRDKLLEGLGVAPFELGRVALRDQE